MTKEEIAAILKDSRVKAGLTQRQAAERVGKKQQTIASWESGQSQPDANTLFVLFEIYNISVDEAFGFRKNPTELATDEYPMIAKYRRLNDSGKEYIDAQLDFAMSQDKYCAKEKRPPHIPDMATIREDAEAYANQLINQNTPTKK